MLEFAATFPSSTTLSAGMLSDSNAAPGYGAQYSTGANVYVVCSDTNNCNGGSPQGSFNLSVTAPGPSQASGSQTLWLSPQGNLTVTLPAQAGGSASGSVTVSVTL